MQVVVSMTIRIRDSSTVMGVVCAESVGRTTTSTVPSAVSVSLTRCSTTTPAGRLPPKTTAQSVLRYGETCLVRSHDPCNSNVHVTTPYVLRLCLKVATTKCMLTVYALPISLLLWRFITCITLYISFSLLPLTGHPHVHKLRPHPSLRTLDPHVRMSS